MAHRAEPVEDWGAKASSRNSRKLGVNVERVVISGETVDMSLLFRDVLFDHKVWLAVWNADNEVRTSRATVLETSSTN